MHNFKAHVESQLRHLAPDASLVAELAQDLEQRYEALIRDGSTAADAWREADEQMDWSRLSLELSRSLPNVREPSGKAGVLSHILRDMRYALRQLTRNPASRPPPS
jgi:hypothetical protein